MGRGRERIGEGEVEGGEEKGREGKGLGCPLALPPDPVLPPNAEFLDPPMIVTEVVYTIMLLYAPR